MHRGLYCPTNRRTCRPRQRGAFRQFGPSSRQGPARSRALVVSRRMTTAACFLALTTACANGTPFWRRRCLVKSAGSSRALSVARSLPLTPAPVLVRRLLKKQVWAPPVLIAASRRAMGPPGGRSCPGPGTVSTSLDNRAKNFRPMAGRPMSSSAAKITLPAAHSVPPATKHSQPWPGSSSPRLDNHAPAGHGATDRGSLDPWTPSRRCRVKPETPRHRYPLRQARRPCRGRGILGRGRRLPVYES